MSLPIIPLTREQVRRVDQVAIERYGMLGVVLMENAGRAAAAWIAENLPAGDVCILCGKGNNGGDGYVVARHLECLYDGWGSDVSESRQADEGGVGDADAVQRSGHVRIVSVVDTGLLRGDAAINCGIAKLAGISIEVVSDRESLVKAIGRPDILVDCLLGTGAVGAPQGLYADAIRIANSLAEHRVAIDLPSGLDCDSGEPGIPTILADQTLTFVAPKVGFANPAAECHVGRVVVLPIGVPSRLLRSLPLPPVPESP